MGRGGEKERKRERERERERGRVGGCVRDPQQSLLFLFLWSVLFSSCFCGERGGKLPFLFFFFFFFSFFFLFLFFFFFFLKSILFFPKTILFF